MISAQYIIKALGVTKEYSSRKRLSDFVLHPLKNYKNLVLDNIDIELKRAELVYLFGLNGAGKTTLLKILSGILLPSKGEVYIDSVKIDNTQKLKERVGFVSGDERSFYWRLTAYDNLKFFGALYGIASKDLNKRLEELFCLFGIDNPNKRFYEYSSGFMQKFCIIRALFHNPDILLLDEPTKNMDYISKEKLLIFVKDNLVAKQKKAVIIAGSSLDNLDFYNRLIILHKAKVKAQGNKDDIKKLLNCE